MKSERAVNLATAAYQALIGKTYHDQASATDAEGKAQSIKAALLGEEEQKGGVNNFLKFLRESGVEGG